MTEPANAALIGRSAAIRTLSDAVIAAAGGGRHVTLIGEAGVGRRSIARLIHLASARAKAGFAAVSCQGLPPLLLHSALLGHKRGAFPGAYCDRLGVLTSLVGGTVYLEEAGALDSGLQDATLRMLTGPCPIVIASANPGCEGRAGHGLGDHLRERHGAVTLRIAPLRDRREDIEPLANHYLEEAGRLLGIREPRLTPETTAVLLRHHWPGNLRELRYAIELGLLRAADGLLTPDALPATVGIDGHAAPDRGRHAGRRPRPARATWPRPQRRSEGRKGKRR